MTDLQKNIISIIQNEGKCSRKYLSIKLGVTAAAITQNTKPLIDQNILTFLYEASSSKAGRKEEIIALKNNAFYTLGIDIEKNSISLVKMNANKGIEEEKEFNSLSEVETYLDKLNMKKCVGVAFSKKGYYLSKRLDEDECRIYQKIKDQGIDVYFENNIASLAYAYKSEHYKDENFLLIKYGPGVGSACFIKNELFVSDKYPTFEIGKLIIDDKGTTLEEKIKYDSLSLTSSPLDEIKENDNLLNEVVKGLALALHNANTLLQLDKIIVSGEIFKEDRVLIRLKEELQKFPNNLLDVSKITKIDDYEELNRKKSALTASYLYLSK